MRVDVIVMIEKTDYSMMEWTLNTDDSSQLPEGKWKKLALKINERARKGRHRRVEIFLYLRDGLLKGISNCGVLEDIAATARQHVWAGDVYVVWDKPRDMSFETGFSKLDNRNLMANFYHALLQERVTNLIEIPPGIWKPSGELDFGKLRTVLRGRVSTLVERRADLKTLVHEDGWSPVLRSESRVLASLLDVFTGGDYLPSSAPNDLIVFEASGGRNSPEKSIKAVIPNSKAARRVVAATVITEAEVKRDCAAEQPPMEVLVFHDIYQVIYALLQLYDAGKSKRAQKNYYLNTLAKEGNLDADAPGEIAPVEVIRGARFPPPLTTTSPLNLLITSAFDEKAEWRHSKAAAGEIGAIRRHVNSLQDVEAHPYMSCQSFPELLESKQYTAWIHLSHGKEGKLYDPQTGRYVPPENWLNCFRAYKGSLSLVIFSSCYSANAARLFASHGVGVAIGFKHQVLAEAPEILTQKIVPAAMHSGGNQGEILVAFRDACRSLAARITDKDENYSEAQPIAFWSDRK